MLEEGLHQKFKQVNKNLSNSHNLKIVFIDCHLKTSRINTMIYIFFNEFFLEEYMKVLDFCNKLNRSLHNL